MDSPKAWVDVSWSLKLSSWKLGNAWMMRVGAEIDGVELISRVDGFHQCQPYSFRLKH